MKKFIALMISLCLLLSTASASLYCFITFPITEASTHTGDTAHNDGFEQHYTTEEGYAVSVLDSMPYYETEAVQDKKHDDWLSDRYNGDVRNAETVSPEHVGEFFCKRTRFETGEGENARVVETLVIWAHEQTIVITIEVPASDWNDETAAKVDGWLYQLELDDGANIHTPDVEEAL